MRLGPKRMVKQAQMEGVWGLNGKWAAHTLKEKGGYMMFIRPGLVMKKAT